MSSTALFNFPTNSVSTPTAKNYLHNPTKNPEQPALRTSVNTFFLAPSRNGRRTISNPLEDWQALFQKSLHSFFLIFRCESAMEEPPLELHAFRQDRKSVV